MATRKNNTQDPQISGRRPTASSAEELTKLMGYDGSIQCTPLETALDEQRTALRRAHANVQIVIDWIGREHGGHCPMALRRAARIIKKASEALEAGVLEDRGIAIARERVAEEVAHV